MTDKCDFKFRCCGCGAEWPNGDLRHCYCPTDVLYQRGNKTASRLKSVWLCRLDGHNFDRPKFRARRAIATAFRRLALMIDATHPTADE